MKQKEWICNSCENKVLAEEKPTGFKWTDGHECDYTEVKIIKAVTAIKNIQKRRAKLRKQFPKRFSNAEVLS